MNETSDIRHQASANKGAVTLPVFLLITLIVVELALAGVITANALNNTLFGERLAIEASQAARAGAQDAILTVVRRCPLSDCLLTSYTLPVGSRSTAAVTIVRDVISGKITVTSIGTAFTRKKKIEAILAVDQTTGQVKVQSFKEVVVLGTEPVPPPPAPSFPTTAILDSFNRADENPASGWNGNTYGGGTHTNIQVVLSRAKGTSASQKFAAYRSAAYGPNQEAYVTIAQKPAGENKSVVWLDLRLQEAGTSGVDGYELELRNKSGTDTVEVFRITNGTFINLGSIVSQEYDQGDGLGASIVGNTITLYRKPQGGDWVQVTTRTDTTYTQAGQIGVGGGSTSDGTIIDDFGGGTSTLLQ